MLTAMLCLSLDADSNVMSHLMLTAMLCQSLDADSNVVPVA